MHSLNSKQRAFLRSLAHRLDPIVHIGSDGLSEAVVKSVEECFNARELIKVRVLESAPEDAKATARLFAQRMSDVHVPLTTGRTVVLYRPFAEDPEIRLP